MTGELESQRVGGEGTPSFFRHLHSGNSAIPFCHTFVTLLAAHLRSGASIMSRTFRTLALSAALLAAMTAPAFASAPTGTNPPPAMGSMMTSSVSILLSFLGF
jgi:hypothetical protein